MTFFRALALASIAVLPVAGCAFDALPFLPIPDGNACTDTASAVSQWLASHTTCATDADCAITDTTCGLAGECGAYTNRSDGAHLQGLLATWQSDHCASPCGLDCAVLAPVACVAGKCQARVGKIGDPCQSDDECVTGQCITATEDPRFTSGYCTVRDCFGVGACPQDSAACSWIPSLNGGAGADVCLARCTQGADASCRDGYTCFACFQQPGLDAICIPTAENLACTG